MQALLASEDGYYPSLVLEPTMKYNADTVSLGKGFTREYSSIPEPLKKAAHEILDLLFRSTNCPEKVNCPDPDNERNQDNEDNR